MYDFILALTSAASIQRLDNEVDCVREELAYVRDDITELCRLAKSGTVTAEDVLRHLAHHAYR